MHDGIQHLLASLTIADMCEECGGFGPSVRPPSSAVVHISELKNI